MAVTVTNRQQSWVYVGTAVHGLECDAVEGNAGAIIVARAQENIVRVRRRKSLYADWETDHVIGMGKSPTLAMEPNSRLWLQYVHSSQVITHRSLDEGRTWTLVT